VELNLPVDQAPQFMKDKHFLAQLLHACGARFKPALSFTDAISTTTSSTKPERMGLCSLWDSHLGDVCIAA